MAFTEQEEQETRRILTAFQHAKRINDLEWAEGNPRDMVVAVQDDDGGTLKMNLKEAVGMAANPMAGRYWDETNASPGPARYYGSLSALQELPQKLGLGRYLVTDDRVRRKLDPTDSTRFEDGSPARLDGNMGQCMWCWNAHYFTTWREGNYTIEVITFLPVEGKKSIYVPAGGISWFNAGVLDRTDLKLCSVISEEERYRGGDGRVLSEFPNLPDDSPCKNMLGMPVSAIVLTEAGQYARKRGEGWEACWYVARAVIEYTLRLIFGTRNIQSDYQVGLDANGLMHGGLGNGVTEMPDWNSFNATYPLIPTCVGLEKGDGTGIVEYDITQGDGTVVYKAPVPVFFGLVNPFGHLYTGVRGLLIDWTPERIQAYVAPSMYAAFDETTTDGLLWAAELPVETEGFIKKYSTHLLCCLPTELGATPSAYFCDYYYNRFTDRGHIRCRGANSRANAKMSAGIYVTDTAFGLHNTVPHLTFPLCYFEEDPLMAD